MNRRKLLTTFGIAGAAAASAPLLAAEYSQPLPEFLKGKEDTLLSVNYKMFGAKGDGKNDDSIQIKQAHDYANKMNLPVINQGGEYWLKKPNNIEIMTNVDWGNTIFHIDEKGNTAADGRFKIVPRRDKIEVELNAEQKTSFLKHLKPGVKLIPEMSRYKNCLLVIVDKNDQIGYRAGAKYNGQSWAREELFYVEEHGRIIGDIAWEFKDYTSLTAHPVDNSYLTVNGGTFYLSGDSSAKSYVKCGFLISRSRTIIQNQWVGLEPGKADISNGPRGGFYTFSRVYDTTLENVRLIPFEQDREGTANDVPQGTYGISAARVLNLLFRNVTAEGGPVHWGVFGTNLNKNFRIENCNLNRVDVHFHCWNLYIKDTNIGYRGISITGGGDLIIENTSCYSRNFVNFRRDFGAKWDGHIRLRNCKFIPVSDKEITMLDFNPMDFDHRYPLGFGRSLIVENMLIDFRAIEKKDLTCWLIKIPTFSKAKGGGRMFFPNYMEFRNVMIEGRDKGVRLFELIDPGYYDTGKPGEYNGAELTPNARMVFENILLEDLTDTSESNNGAAHLSIKVTKEAEYADAYALYPEIRFTDCKNLNAKLGGQVANVTFERCGLASVIGSETGMLRGRFAFSDCLFLPSGKNDQKVFYNLSSELGTSFTNCTIHAPKVNGVVKPELADLNGFVILNKRVKYNHLNTQLGNEIIRYWQLKKMVFSPQFISMLKCHHQLEKEEV